MTTRAKICAALGLAFIVAGVAVATDQSRKPGYSLPEAKDGNLGQTILISDLRGHSSPEVKDNNLS